MNVQAWMVFLLAVISLILCFSVKKPWVRLVCVAIWAIAVWCTASAVFGPLF